MLYQNVGLGDHAGQLPRGGRCRVTHMHLMLVNSLEIIYTPNDRQRTNSLTYPKVGHKTSAFAFVGVSVTVPIASGCLYGGCVHCCCFQGSATGCQQTDSATSIERSSRFSGGRVTDLGGGRCWEPLARKRAPPQQNRVPQ